MQCRKEQEKQHEQESPGHIDSDEQTNSSMSQDGTDRLTSSSDDENTTVDRLRDTRTDADPPLQTYGPDELNIHRERDDNQIESMEIDAIESSVSRKPGPDPNVKVKDLLSAIHAML